MSRKCKACNHPERATIDECIAKNKSLRDISGQFGISKNTVASHKKHIAEIVDSTRTAVKSMRGYSIQDWLIEYHKNHFDLVAAAKINFSTKKTTDADYNACFHRYLDVTSQAIAAIQRSGIVAIAANDSAIAMGMNERANKIADMLCLLAKNIEKKSNVDG